MGSITICYTCEFTNEEYFEPGNKTYAFVMNMLWPDALPGFSNKETIGDVLEAFLGYAYLVRLNKLKSLTSKCHWDDFQWDIVSLLNYVVWFVFIHWDRLTATHK